MPAGVGRNGAFMSNRKRVSAVILSIILILSLSSCALLGAHGVTKSEVQQMLDNSMAGNVTVEGGDNYNVTINGVSLDNAVAGKALLSAVSIRCKFNVRTSSGFPYGSTVTEAASAGSGVIYKLDKNRGNAYIITNYHVVYDSSSITENGISDSINVYLYGQESEAYAIPAAFVGGSMQYDIAILRVSGSRIIAESNATAVAFADSDDVSVLDQAIAVGNPEALGISATLGYINVDSEYIEMESMDGVGSIDLRVMRMDTAVNSGNSGGGLFNNKGDLIGIVNAKLASSENVSYAIPSNLVKYVADNIMHYCDGTKYENVFRCYLGIEVTASKMYTVYDLESGKVHKREEVSVYAITSGGLADGHLAVGDVINSITVDGIKYETNRIYSVTDPMINARVGSSVTINVKRGAEILDITITVTESALTMMK